MGRGDKATLHAQAESVRQSFATLIGASPDEIAITKNASDGLNQLGASLPWEAGDNVVVCPELEHPNNVVPWFNLARRFGIEIREVPPEDGHVPVDGLIRAIDARTQVVTLSHVTFSPGLIADVRALVNGARSRGALVVVDGAQSVGGLRTDVQELGVDALATGTQKALMGLYGLGFLYVRREVAESLTPSHAARYSIDLGSDAHETALGGRELQYQSGARRFDLSNYNYLGLAGVEPSLDLIHSLGMERIESHVRGLASRLASGFLELGLPVAGGPPGPQLAHIVAVGRTGGGRHYTADDPRMNDLHGHLTRNRVHLSIRRGVLRMSVGVYNNQGDIDRVIELAREWKG
jgi:cysteine desulfurase/selenocysteine lyase